MRKTSLFILSLLICAALCTAAVFAADGEKI
jgi:predicted small secreted protein